MSSIRVVSTHSELKIILIRLRDAWPWSILTVSFTIYNNFVFSSCSEKWSFSSRLLSSKAFTCDSKSLDVQIIMFTFSFSFSFFSIFYNSSANYITQRIGVINSCDTLDVSRFRRLFFYSTISSLRYAEMSLIEKILHSLSLKIKFEIVIYTGRLESDPIGVRKPTKSPYSPKS